MTGLLLESRRKRQRRTGGASLSVAVHSAIIGAIITGTTTAKPSPKVVEAYAHLVALPKPQTERHSVAPATAARAQAVPRRENLVPPTIVAPTITPAGIPTVDLFKSALDSVVIASSAPAGRSGRPGRSLDLTAGDATQSDEWRGTELLMRIVASRKPRYPESLRQAGVDGRVLVRFTVDTLGAVDMTSVRILESTHDLFTRSVREVLSSFRFKPAEIGGRRVPSLAEMPFEFSISK